MESAFYGPLVGLPVLMLFMSAVGYETGLITFAAFGSVVAIALLGLMHAIDRFSRVHLAASFAAAAFTASIAVTHWPLRATFSMARSSLDEIASRRCVDTPADGYERAGVFTVKSVRLDDSGACRLSLGKRYAQVEFVRLPDPMAIESLQPVSSLRLDAHWYHIEIAMSDYEAVER